MKRQVVERYEMDCGELVVPGSVTRQRGGGIPAPDVPYVRAEVADELLAALVDLFDFAGIDLKVPLHDPVMQKAKRAICKACGS